jgi:diguanylate cyclase (GGDEF)-like protein
LDHFKFVNDTLGHDVGDLVLTTIAKRLTSCLRDADTAARSGGDEFLLILVDHESTESISAVIRRLLEVIAQPILANEQSLYVTCSIGISLFSQDGDNASTLLKNADTAMYHAKEKGRNNFQFFNSEMNLRVHERFMLESSLRQAMADNVLTLAYQPQIDILSGQVIGVEALLRWKHAELGMIPPAKFIPIAEESGLIITLGEWVLRTACTQAKAWQDLGIPAMTVAVNLSARQVKQNNLPHLVKTILAETGLAAKYLELELTESLAFENAEKLVLVLTQLKALGLQITIDDFGTGYSSLSYLKHLPLDRLKIDISFVHDIVFDKGDEAIAKIIILLGHSLRLKVIAEGVETNEQLNILLSQGCDEIQGFYYSEPLSVTDLEKFLLSKKNVSIPKPMNLEILKNKNNKPSRSSSDAI